MFNNEFLRKNKILGLLVLIMTIYTIILIYCQTIRAISYWDIFVYLQNSMLFAGTNIGSQLTVPPVLSLLVSIPFRLGFVSETTLFIVTGSLFIFLVIGVYLLLNEKFNEQISLLASILFSMFSLIVTWAISGATDVPALCFAVWALYLTTLGLNKDFKYYYLAIFFFVLAFFTRFTEGFILIVMLFYLFVNLDKFKEQLTKERFIKIVLYCAVLGAVICGIYLVNEGNIPFITQFLEVSKSSQVSSINVGYELNPYYYIQNLPEYFTSLSISDSYFITLSTSENTPTLLSYVFLVLVLIYLVKFVSNLVKYEEKEVNYKYLKIAVMLILSIIGIFSYTHISYMISELLFIIIMSLYYKWLPDNTNKLDYVMILWMGIYLIMHSYHPVKVDRYIIPIFVPLTYLTIQSISYILKDNKKIITALLILLIIMIPINACYINSITQPNPHTQEEISASEFIKDYDPNYKEYNISSDRGVSFSWYLKKYTYTTIPRVLEADNESLVDKLNSIEAKYYIDSTSNTTNITGYHEIYEKTNQNTKIKIYQRD